LTPIIIPLGFLLTATTRGKDIVATTSGTAMDAPDIHFIRKGSKFKL